MGKLTGSDVGEEPSKGVRKRGNKWVAEIRNRHLRGGRHPGRKWLGTFSTAADAREAYARAVKKIKSSSQRAPGNGSSKTLIPPGASHTSLSVSSALSSLSACTGEKRVCESSPVADEQKTSKKARRRVSLGSAGKDDHELVSSGLDSTHHEEIKDSASFDQEGGKGAVAMQSSTVSSSCDSPRGTLPTSQLAKKSRRLRSKEFDGTTSKTLPGGLCFTSLPNSRNSNSSCNVNDQASAAVSPSSSSATSRWIDERVKNPSFDSSIEELTGREKDVDVDARDADGSSNSRSAPREVSNGAPGVSTIFSNSNTITTTVNDNINCSPAGPEDRLCNCPSSTAEQAHQSPVCRCLSFFTGNEKGSPVGTGSCFWNCTCQFQLDVNNQNGELEGLDNSVQNGASNQGQNFLQLQEREDLAHSSENVNEVAIEDLAVIALKTRHRLSELRPESDLESRCTEIPPGAHHLCFSQPILSSNRNTGPSPVFLLSGSSPMSGRYAIPEHQVPVIDPLNHFEHPLKAELVETDSLNFGTAHAYLSDFDLPHSSFRESNGLDFSPVDDLLGYF